MQSFQRQQKDIDGHVVELMQSALEFLAVRTERIFEDRELAPLPAP